MPDPMRRNICTQAHVYVITHVCSICPQYDLRVKTAHKDATKEDVTYATPRLLKIQFLYIVSFMKVFSHHCYYYFIIYQTLPVIIKVFGRKG